MKKILYGIMTVLLCTAVLHGCAEKVSSGTSASSSAAAKKETAAAESKAPAAKAAGTSDVKSTGSSDDENSYEKWKYSKQISVGASADREIVPDRANFTVSVRTREKTAKDCYAKNAEAVNSTVNAIKALGIKDENIKTANVSMQEVFSYEEKTNKRISDGYEMTSTISVKGIEIEKTGDVISAAVGNGSNTISGITYESSKYDETYQATLKEAVELAKKKADLMASAGGSTIQEMISIKENYEDTSARYTGVSADAAPKSLAANSASARTQTPVSVEPGTIKIHASVNAAFRIDR